MDFRQTEAEAYTMKLMCYFRRYGPIKMASRLQKVTEISERKGTGSEADRLMDAEA